MFNVLLGDCWSKFVLNVLNRCDFTFEFYMKYIHKDAIHKNNIEGAANQNGTI